MNLVIRPPRAQYDPARALPGPALRVDSKNFVRTDLQARNERTNYLELTVPGSFASARSIDATTA